MSDSSDTDVEEEWRGYEAVVVGSDSDSDSHSDKSEPQAPGADGTATGPARKGSSMVVDESFGRRFQALETKVTEQSATLERIEAMLEALQR